MLIQQYQGEHKIEYSIVNVSELEGAVRIDAGYYHPVYLRNEKIIEKKNFEFLRNVVSNDYENFKPNCDYFNYIEISNINLETGEYIIKKIPCKKAPSRAKKLVSKDDIIISTVRPNRNAVAIITHDIKNLVASTGFCKLTTKRINPKYLFILFKTFFYRDFLVRKTTATMYPAVSEDDLINLKIPIPPTTFQKQIENLALSAYKEREKADKLYKEAEDILLEELRLKNWKPKTKKIKINGKEFEEEENMSIRMLSEVIKTNRMDTEYWLPKYDDFLTLLNNLKKKDDIELKNLSMLVDYKKGVEVGSEQYSEEGQIPFIRVSNLNEKGINLNSAKYISGKLYNKLKEQYEPNEGEILFTKDATIGIGYLLEKPIKAIISSGILRLIVKNEKVNKEYLYLVLNSPVCKLQINKTSSGAIIKHFKPTEVMNLLIPLLNQQTQSKISQKIQQSFKVRRKSRELLEIAKRGVEIYIENDEQKGINYITKQLQDLN